MNRKKKAAIVAESLLVTLLCAGGIILRIYCFDNIGMESPYFDMAKVSAEQGIPTVVHGAVHIYIQLLHLVYVIFGNNFIAGIWLQILLQVLAGAFLYTAVRKMAGAVSAVISLGFFTLSPLMINEALTLSPGVLFLAAFSLVLCLCTKCIKDWNGVFSNIVAGTLISLVCYLDIVGIVLLIFAVTGILWIRNQTETSVKKRLAGVLLCLMGCVAGFFVTLVIDSLLSGKGIGGILQAWWKLFAPSAFEFSTFVSPEALWSELLLLAMLLLFGIFSFLPVCKIKGQYIWALTAFGLVLLQVLGMPTEELSGDVLLFLLASVLAAVAISCMFVKEDVLGNSACENRKQEAQLEIMSLDTEEENAECEEIMPKVQLIENPLPLPKKHVKKVMDFEHQPEAGKDDFDVAVADDDDFDI